MKKLNKLFALLLAAAMLFTLTACGGKEEDKPEVTPTPAAGRERYLRIVP